MEPDDPNPSFIPGLSALVIQRDEMEEQIARHKQDYHKADNGIWELLTKRFVQCSVHVFTEGKYKGRKCKQLEPLLPKAPCVLDGFDGLATCGLLNARTGNPTGTVLTMYITAGSGGFVTISDKV